MKILIVEQEIPFPANTGKKIRTLNFINSLIEKHEISFLCSNSDCNQKETGDFIKKFKKTWLVDHSSRCKNDFETANRIKKFILMKNGIPWEIQWSYWKQFNDKFVEVIGRFDFDIIFTRYISQAQYIFRNIKKIKAKCVIDLDDIEIIKDERRNSTRPHRYTHWYEKFRTKYNLYLYDLYHKNLKSVNKCLVCSKEDKEYVENKRWANNVCVIPNSIDFTQYKAVKDFNEQILNNKIILFCGHMGYRPNTEGIEWFKNKVFPLIKKEEPNIKLYIVGRTPNDKILDYHDGKSIFVFKDVPSVLPYYQESSLVIVPIHIGGGTRIKAIEALACKRPVVATTIGIEGLELINNKHCHISDTPEAFASSCIKLLNNYDLASQLVNNGYQFAEKYDTKNIAELIRDIFNNT